MKLLLTGGTGFIGQHLIQQLARRESEQGQACELTVLTRSPEQARRKLGAQCELISEVTSVDGFDAVINLAGEPIANKRWSESQKLKICDSRWLLTKHIADLIQRSDNPPSVFISGSAVGYYGDQGAAEVNEQTEPLVAQNTDFAHEVCREWEAFAQGAQSERTRVCLLRTGLVLGKGQGVLGRLLPLYKLGLGGPIGNGEQYQPWIHIEDEVRAILFLLDNHQAEGPFNLTAPNPVTNNQFSKTLAEVLNRPDFLRAPEFALKLALGEMSQLLLGGQKAQPCALQKLGFEFQYPELRPALESLLK